MAASATCMAKMVGWTLSMPVTVLGRGHRLGHREAGLARRSAVRSRRSWRRTPVRSRAARRPSPPTASPARRTPTPVRGRRGRPPPGTGVVAGRRSRAEPGDSSLRVARRPPRCARSGVRAGAPACRPDRQSELVAAALHPFGQPTGGLAQRVGRGRRQREQQRRRSAAAGVAADRRLGRGACFEDGVHVGARTCRTTRRAARRGGHRADRPRRNLLRHEQIRCRSAASSSGSAVKCSIAGTYAVRSDRIALISPTAPAADSAWPKLLFTEPSAQRSVLAVHLGQAGEFDRIADRGAGAVCLDDADRVGVDARRRQRRPVHRDLRVPRRRGDRLRCGRPELAAVPRMTASMRSPSRCASDRRLSSSTPQPSERTKPSAPASNGWHRPVGDSMPCADADAYLRRLQHHHGSPGQRHVALTGRPGCGRPGGRRAARTSTRCRPSATDRCTPSV